MKSKKSLKDLLKPIKNTNAQNFTLFVLSKHFADICSDELNQMTDSYRITNNIAANQLLLKFSRAISNAIQDYNNTPDLYDVMNTLLDPNDAIVEKALERVAKITIGTGINLFKHEMPNQFIIYEERINEKTIIKLISKYSDELVSPPITILILKDNNFIRAKNYLDLCPNNTVIKFIHSFNDDDNEIFLVYNNGAKSSRDFFEFFGAHCFSTCSNTPNEIIINSDRDNGIDGFSQIPMLLKYKSSLVIDEKDSIKFDINNTVENLYDINHGYNSSDTYRSLECLARSFRMLCYDSGIKDIKRTLELAKDVKTPLVQANALKFSHFMPIPRTEKQELLKIASDIFEKDGIIDQSIYCLNNKYLHEFSLKDHSLVSRKFKRLVTKAECDAVGMAGMPHLINNLGVSYIFEANYNKAIEAFYDGLDYVNDGNHLIQYFAIISNLLIAKYLNAMTIKRSEIKRIIDEVFIKTPSLKVDYLIGHYVLNILAICISFDSNLYRELVNDYPIHSLIERALTNNMGTGSMTFQMNVLTNKYPAFDILTHINLPTNLTEFIGERKIFTEKTGFNPFIFNIWL